jgi:acetyltransferase-like isoleucine patch superfamily enzyme
VTVQIHPSAKISTHADIEASVRGSNITIGKNVIIDSFVKIKPAGGSGDLVIGENTVINSGTVLYTGAGLYIGANVAIAANCVFAPVNHAYHRRDVLIRNQGFSDKQGAIWVGDDVWIGAGAVVLAGSRIGTGCVVGALSLVRTSLADYCVYAGNPLKKIGERR